MAKETNDNKQRIEILGEEYGSFYNALYIEILTLSLKWNMYIQLYGINEEQIGTMNKTAPSLFYIIQQNFWESIILSISRLTDPKETRNIKNVSINALSDFLATSELEDKLNSQIKSILEISKVCRDWRNKWISHKDRLIATNKHAEPLKPTERNLLQSLVTEFENLLNTLESFYFKRTIAFHWFEKNDGPALLKIVEDGFRFDRIKYKWLFNKNLTDEDFGE